MNYSNTNANERNMKLRNVLGDGVNNCLAGKHCFVGLRCRAVSRCLAGSLCLAGSRCQL